MKLSRIYYLLIFVMGSLFLASCSDDDNNNVADDGVKVVAAATSFDANGGSQEIVVNKDVVKVYAADAWLSVEGKGTNVAIEAGANASLESRHTTVVIKASESDSTIVNVSQMGSVFSLEGLDDGIAATSDAAASFTYTMKHVLPVEVSASDEWIVPSVDGETLKVDLAENATGHLRRGWVAYACGTNKDTIDVVQYDFDKDIAGDYYFMFTQQTGASGGFMSTLAKTSAGYTLSFPALGFELPVSFDETTCELSISGGSYMGEYPSKNGVYYIYSVLIDSSTGNGTWSSSVNIAAPFDYDEEDGVYAMFEDTGSWDGGTADCLSMYAFSEKDPSNDTAVGYIMNMFSPYMVKADAASARKLAPATAVKFSAPARLSFRK